MGQSLALTLGKYELVRRIGQGGMAEVFLARARSIGGFERLVVIKRLLPALVAEAGMVKMFLDEARLAAQLHHTNIGQVFDVDQAQGAVFYAMEYLRGRDLHALAATLRATETAFPLDQAIAITAAMCSGLHYAHQLTDPRGEHLSLVHRDVTPHNVVVTFDGGVKVIDFGIAKIAGTRLQTQAGQLRGKIRYMSPEQVLQQPLDGRSDVFATAIVLYELITGRRLFDLGDYDALQAIVYKDVPPPSTVNPAVPPPLDAILQKGLARDRAGRYPTALAMQIELQEFARANRLDLSPLGVAHLIAKVFPDEAAQTTKPILESLREDTGAWALGEDGSIQIEVIEGTATTPERLDALATQMVPPDSEVRASTKTLPPESPTSPKSPESPTSPKSPKSPTSPTSPTSYVRASTKTLPPALEPAASTQTLPPEPVVPVQSTTAPRRRRPWAVLAVFVAVLGAGAGIAGQRLFARTSPAPSAQVHDVPAQASTDVPDVPDVSKTNLAQQQVATPPQVSAPPVEDTHESTAANETTAHAASHRQTGAKRKKTKASASSTPSSVVDKVTVQIQEPSAPLPPPPTPPPTTQSPPPRQVGPDSLFPH